jgi:hypothetical protein
LPGFCVLGSSAPLLTSCDQNANANSICSFWAVQIQTIDPTMRRARAGAGGGTILVGGDAIDTLRLEIVRRGVRRTLAVQLGDAPN